jgi:hypothetical protein
MSGTATPIFPQTIKNYVAQILPADTTTKKTLVTGATNGTKIETITVASTDTTARELQFIMTVSSVDYVLATVSIPANSGFTISVPAVDVLRHTQWPSLAYDSNGNKILYVANGAVLSVKVLVAVAASKEIDILAIGGDF